LLPNQFPENFPIFVLCCATEYDILCESDNFNVEDPMTKANHSDIPRHPGTHVRAEVIPAGMSVTKAAQQLGIGRPALSNFLNGRSSLSHEMAVRLEKAFKADSKKLLDMQVAWDRRGRRDDDRKVAVTAFVPAFLAIKARQIENWANEQEARSCLPVLLRRLVHTTGNELRRVDFPGYDNAQRRGSDGFVEASAATPWVPEGKSHWEFGTNRDSRAKAEHDYGMRLESINSAEREESTFVFVTPRNWPGKTKWEEEKNETGNWKAVRAFDASDIEQWLEQSPPAQIWLAEQLRIPNDGYETLEQAWHRWADVCEPRLTRDIFTPSLSAYRGTFKAWLDKPSKKPFVVTADSRDEALAFLACMFEDEELREYGDLTAVFESPETLRKLVSSPFEFIPIVHSEAAERALSDAHRRLHCIVFRPHNLPAKKPDIALDLLDHDAFEKALKAMGVEPDKIDRLARESGRSPTILRRRLSTNAAIGRPEWASNNKKARRLMPITLVGAWHAGLKADRKIVSKLAKRKHDAIEDDIQFLLNMDDSPVWSSDPYHGVVSKIDALHSVAHVITKSVLDRFFRIAKDVLSDSDPALGLSEKDRWDAALHGKTRDHFNALRKGLLETLIIFSVHGNDLFPRRSGIDIEGRTEILIRDILTPLTPEKLLSQDNNLPGYAEAAPDVFLQIVEEDLQSKSPVTLNLLKPVDSGLFSESPSRTGLLWALECLAWRPQNLMRTVKILAQLSQHRIDDNWGNKPINSLQAIFRSWMPQTAASLEQRVEALEHLTKRFPDIAWNIYIAPWRRPIGEINYRPRWRGDASGAGQVVTAEEMQYFKRKALDTLISWQHHDEKTLGDLVEILPRISGEDANKIWVQINEWSKTADETKNAVLREHIRRFVLTPRGPSRKLADTVRTRAREVYESLRPSDPVIRHRWQFDDQWVPESVDDSDDENFDYRKLEERIHRQRGESMAEILVRHNFEGIRELLAENCDAFVVGWFAASCIRETENRIDFIRSCLSLDKDLLGKVGQCLEGFLSTLDDNVSTEVLRAVAEQLPANDRVRLLVRAPFRASTWRLLDGYDDDIRDGYWKTVLPSRGPHTPADLDELIDRLLAARRPRAAFRTVESKLKDVETSRLKRLLRDAATSNAEPASDFRLEPWYISKALDSLDGRPGVTVDEMAQLEFLFIGALDDSEHGIPNLERKIAQSPELFVQAVALAYNRSDEGKDPPEWSIENREQRESVSRAARCLLDKFGEIPGADEDGKIDSETLVNWLDRARHLFRTFARVKVGDIRLGQLLAKAPGGENGLWPCEAICEAMEKIGSQEVREGFSIEVYNSRGIYTRGIRERGNWNRVIAACREGAERLRFKYPFVSSVLDNIAARYDRGAKMPSEFRVIQERCLFP